MRINQPGDIATQGATPRATADLARAKQAADAKSAAAAAAYRGDVARVSVEARGLSATMKSFDLEKVEQLRGALADKKLVAHPARIAERMMEDA